MLCHITFRRPAASGGHRLVGPKLSGPAPSACLFLLRRVRRHAAAAALAESLPSARFLSLCGPFALHPPLAEPSLSSTKRSPVTVGIAMPYTGSPGTCRKFGAPSISGVSRMFWHPAHGGGQRAEWEGGAKCGECCSADTAPRTALRK